MKTNLLVFFIIINSILFAQKNELIKVQHAIDKLTNAMIAANEKDLNSITSNHLSYGHSNGRIENKNNFIQNILLKKSVFLNIQLNDQTIDIINKTAIVRHHFTATTNDNGVSNIVHLKVLLVFIKEKNNWVLIARQSIKI